MSNEEIKNSIEELKHLNSIGNVLGTSKHIAIDNVLEYVKRLESKLMYALSPTDHELSLNTKNHFIEIIRENMEEDTYTIKREMKKYWKGLCK